MRPHVGFLLNLFLFGLKLRQFQLHLHQAAAANYVSQRLDATANTHSVSDNGFSFVDCALMSGFSATSVVFAVNK